MCNRSDDRVVWRNAPGFPDYMVSAIGVWSKKRGRFLSHNTSDANPYPRVCLRHDGRSSVRYVHHLVHEAFHGPRVRGMHVRHIDGDPMNYDPDNLTLGTPKENMHDKRRHGTDPRGRRNPNAKLSAAQVCEMRGHIEDGHMSRKDIARIYGVSIPTVSSIATRRTWSHV